MSSDQANSIATDSPLTRLEDDRLQYVPLAEHLANIVSQLNPADGLTVAVYGSWGSGKTTFLEFVLRHLEGKAKSEQPVIVRFNPWWFSGHEDLALNFFTQFQRELELSGRFGNLIQTFASLGEIISYIPVPHAEFGERIARRLRGEDKTVRELKEEIAAALSKQEHQILVVIDDIDRLSAEEIRQLFKVIKAIADFPRVIYLLAFDKNVVVTALTETQGLPGEAYLEKIVQLPLELPLPDRSSLRAMLFQKLDSILIDPANVFDKTYWGNVYWDGIDHFIRTPRDVVRLTNALAVTYSAVAGEVNPTDFVAIETIRVFCPNVYEVLRNNLDWFTGGVNSPASQRQPSQEQTFHEQWMAQVSQADREAIRRLLTRLFPRLESVWSNRYYDSYYSSEWRRMLRVCSPTIAPIYFRLGVHGESISNQEVRAILALAKDSGAFSEALVSLSRQQLTNHKTKARVFLERLEDFTERDIELEDIPSIISALFDVGDVLIEADSGPTGVFDFDIGFNISRITWRLLRRLPEHERYTLLERAVNQGHGLSVIVSKVAVLGQQHGKYSNTPSPPNEWIVNAEQLANLERLALSRIHESAEREELLKKKELLSIMHRWADWGSEEEVRQWVDATTQSDIGLVNFLERFLWEQRSHTMGDRVARSQYRLDPRLLDRFIDPSQIIERVRRIRNSSEISDDQRIATERFITEYEALQQGNDPEEAGE